MSTAEQCDTERRRARQHAEYLDAYAAWMNELPQSEIERLAEMGLDRPDSDIPQINGKGQSVENLTFLAEEYEQPEPESDTSASDVLLRAMMELSAAENVKLKLDAFLSALGAYDHEGKTCEDLGRMNGCSKQRFSTVRSDIIDRYGLRAPRTCRTAKQRASRRVNKFGSSRRVSEMVWAQFVGPSGSMIAWINRRKSELDVDQWPQEYRAAIMDRCKPIVELCAELAAIEEKGGREGV